MDVEVTAVGAAIPNGTKIFAGFKNAFDIVSKFTWKVNGTDFQTENFCYKFSNLMNLSVSQETR